MGDHDDFEDEEPSKSELKRQSGELQNLGDELVALPATECDAIDLPDELREAVVTARRITAHGARVRQRLYIGKLLRQIDVEPIRAAIAARAETDRQRVRREHVIEQWRERLLLDEPAAWTELGGMIEARDLQQLRSLVRHASAGGQPAQVVAVIPAPVVPIPDNPNGLPQFGEPVWVKVIKTTSQNPNPVALKDLVSDDDPGPAHAGMAKWQNGEPDTVETEWKLLQRNNDPDVNPQDELAGAVVEIRDVSENVTRRYEFYEYVRYVKGVDPATPVADSLDGETREAMCDEVDPNSDPNDPTSWIGVNANRAVTDPNGDTYYVDCTAQVVVGNYIGAQMAGFDADAPLGLIDHLQDGEMGTPYVNRTVVIGGNVPYTTINVTGLPNGLSLSGSGMLSGTPTESGDFNVTVEGAGATPLAGILKQPDRFAGRKVVSIISRGNIDVNILHRIITRGLAVAGRTVELQVRLLDVPGTLTAVLEIVKELHTNILDINHHRFDSLAPFGYVDVSLTLETKGHPHIQEVKQVLQAEGYLL